MKSVQKINQLYGHETLDRLHRRNARFINSCMMHTLLGAAVSDGLENGQVVSGVGGQYNFVAMAQELPDGNSILNLRSTRTKAGKTLSSIVPAYGHITIPRHLRDVVVTEYGIAYIRGCTDEEIIQKLLNICDSRFQSSLLNWAKKVGKLKKNYKIPTEFTNNLPTTYTTVLEKYKSRGYFSDYPFGTDLTDQEIALGKALKALKSDLKSLPSLLKTILKALFARTRNGDKVLLERMKLLTAKSLKEKIYKQLLLVKIHETTTPP